MKNKVISSGTTFIDIDKRGKDWSFPDYECDRVPRKGDVMQFNHIVGNDTARYFGEVLFVIDERTMWGEPRMQDCDVKTNSITVVMREITGKFGNATYDTILNAINHERK